VLEWLDDFKKPRFADFSERKIIDFLHVLRRPFCKYYFEQETCRTISHFSEQIDKVVYILINISELYRQRQGLPPKLQVSGHVHLFSLKEVCIFHELIMKQLCTSAAQCLTLKYFDINHSYWFSLCVHEQLISNSVRFKPALTKRDKIQTMIYLWENWFKKPVMSLH
jgi:hypothetical protein